MVNSTNGVRRRTVCEPHFRGEMVALVGPAEIRERHAVEARLVELYFLLRKRRVRRILVAHEERVLAGRPERRREKAALIVRAKPHVVVRVIHFPARPVRVCVASLAHAGGVVARDRAIFEVAVLHEVHAADAGKPDFIEGVSAVSSVLRLRELERVGTGFGDVRREIESIRHAAGKARREGSDCHGVRTVHHLDFRGMCLDVSLPCPVPERKTIASSLRHCERLLCRSCLTEEHGIRTDVVTQDVLQKRGVGDAQARIS